MKLSYGSLMFEEDDILHINDVNGKETLVVKKGHECNKCEFNAICDERKSNNVFAKYCKETHFEKLQLIQ